jgi:hypothetical protein
MAGVAVVLHGHCGLAVVCIGRVGLVVPRVMPGVMPGVGFGTRGAMTAMIAVLGSWRGRGRNCLRRHCARWGGMAGFPGHDVGVAPGEGRHRLVRVTPGCGRGGGVGQRRLRCKALVNQRRGGRMGERRVGRRWRLGSGRLWVALSQHRGWRYQEQGGQQA